MKDLVRIEFRKEEIRDIHEVLSQTISWIEGLHIAGDDSSPVNTDIDIDALCELNRKMEISLFNDP